MDPRIKKMDDLLFNDKINSIPALLDNFDYMMTTQEFGVTDILKTDEDLIKEIETFDSTKASLYFGESLSDLLISYEKDRKLNMWVQYIAPKGFYIKDMDMPFPYNKDQLFKTLDEAADVFVQHVNKLSNYFYQLDRIKELCSISEPVKPTYKEDYRKIKLADRIWLLVEVSKDGSAKKLKLDGQYERHQNKLQELLLAWDHEKDIATNILTIICSLNGDNTNILKELLQEREMQQVENKNPCSICLCFELSDNLSKSGTSIPQPLCSNTSCGAYYHKSCLYEWFVYEGGRPSRCSSVAIGACPSCRQPVQCNEKDI